jgi:hypothetical protein
MLSEINIDLLWTPKKQKEWEEGITTLLESPNTSPVIKELFLRALTKKIKLTVEDIMEAVPSMTPEQILTILSPAQQDELAELLAKRKQTENNESQS